MRRKGNGSADNSTPPGLLSNKLYGIMMSCDKLKGYLNKLNTNNMSNVINQFKHQDDFLGFLSETERASFLAVVVRHKTCFESAETSGNSNAIMNLRAKQYSERDQASGNPSVLPWQTIVEGIALRLRMWHYPDEVTSELKFEGILQ